MQLCEERTEALIVSQCATATTLRHSTSSSTSEAHNGDDGNQTTGENQL